MTNNEYILELLKEDKLIYTCQAEYIIQKLGDSTENIFEFLEKMNIISEMDALKAIANRFGMEMIDLSNTEIKADALNFVTNKIARNYRIIPICINKDNLTIALNDPLDMEAIDAIRYFLKLNITAMIASAKDINEALDKYYPKQEEINAIKDIPIECAFPSEIDLDYMETAIQRHTGGFKPWWEQAKNELSGRDLMRIIITIWESGRGKIGENPHFKISDNT